MLCFTPFEKSCRFRILVVGKSGSGKSSLISSVFKVDVTAAPERALGKNDINFEYCPEDNRYLIVHECSGLESRAGDSQNFLDIWNFILDRTDLGRSASERLHAVWICVPASDAINGNLGEEVEEILGMRTVPVILAFTKFDVVVSKVPFDIERGDARQHEHARARAREMYEDSCHRLFQKDPRDVPAVIVSDKPRYAELVENLVAMTDRFILGSDGPTTGSGVYEEIPRVSAVPLAWSAAIRVSHNIVFQASIDVGRSRYWHRLQSNVEFTDQKLKSCVTVIHEDLVEIWNLNDRDKDKYLSSYEFKAKMSHVVKDLVGPASSLSMTSDPYPSGAAVDFAIWVHGVYKGSQANVRCIMGYIVDLVVILDGIFNTTCDGSLENVQLAIDSHVSSGNKDKIHRDIREFVTGNFEWGFYLQHTDLILEKIIDLIQHYVSTPTGNTSSMP
ncbi:hypothetical protein EI94DRAFT_1788047 [Lactarius quietus]|nr:hypothetical protein EI94DRAFT_1788047 [Lactarius quietus]